MSHGDTIPLHPSSQSDIDEIENLINAGPATVLPAGPPSPPRASIPVSSSPFIPSNLPPPAPSAPAAAYQKAPTSTPPIVPSVESSRGGIAADGFGSPSNSKLTCNQIGHKATCRASIRDPRSLPCF